MLIILPDVGRSLEDVEENMSPYILELTKHRKKTHIDLEIPQFKFKFESTFLAKLNTVMLINYSRLVRIFTISMSY